MTGLFSGRGFNIESLCVAETFDPQASCLTVVTRGEAAIIEQITKQLHKLIDVIKISDVSEGEFVEREMVLIRVRAEASTRRGAAHHRHLPRQGGGREPHLYAFEITGSDSKIKAVIDILRPLGIKEIVRTRKIAMMRAPKK